MPTFTAIDFETANYNRTSICQVGLVRVEKGRVVQEISRLIRPPGNWYIARFTDIHGIDASMTEHAPTFGELWPDLSHYIEGCTLVAHNGHSFDFDVLVKTAAHYGLPAPHFLPVCTYRIYRQNLAALCATHRIPLDHHEALSDAKACARLYLLSLGVQPLVGPAVAQLPV